MFRSRKYEVGDNPLSKPILVEQIGAPKPLSDSQMLEFLGKFISEREQYISEQQEQIYSEQQEVESEEKEEPEQSNEEQPEVMSTVNAKITQISSANQYISQLNRMERSLKGFAPSIVEQGNSSSNKYEKEDKPKNKKTTFNDDNEETGTQEKEAKLAKSKPSGKKIVFD